MLTNLNMTDVETGYKAFRGEIIRNMIIKSSGFGVEIEITAKVPKLGWAIYEVPISYYGRTYEEGKQINPGRAAGVLACLPLQFVLWPWRLVSGDARNRFPPHGTDVDWGHAAHR